jgi:hypothetical protein
LSLRPVTWPLAGKLAGVFAVATLLLTACGGSGHLHIAGGSGSPSVGAEPGVTTFVCRGTTNDTLLQAPVTHCERYAPRRILVMRAPGSWDIAPARARRGRSSRGGHG